MLWTKNLRAVEPYVAGEQPKLDRIIKLNTNENPYPPSPRVQEVLAKINADQLRLYPSADAENLRAALAAYYGLSENQIFIGNGSDEVLALSFLTFFNGKKPLLFPDISYSFYPVYAELYQISYQKVPLAENFELIKEDYFVENSGIVFPNPNAPTAIELDLAAIEEILQKNPESIVLVDEAYVDFGGRTALPLLDKYDNLVISRTFSKSHSLAGIRLGVALGHPVAISHLYDVKNSFNSYTIDAVAQQVGLASLTDTAYLKSTLKKIISTRERFLTKLREFGFIVTDSKANFVFAKHPKIDANELFEALYAEHIVVRHWNSERIKDWLRITIGTDEEMKQVVQFLENYLKDKV